MTKNYHPKYVPPPPILSEKDYADAMIEPPKETPQYSGQFSDKKEIFTLNDADMEFIGRVFAWTVSILFIGFCLVILSWAWHWFVQELSPIADSTNAVMPKVNTGLSETFIAIVLVLGIYAVAQIFILDREMS
jgi:hypothetical protein